MTSMSFEEFEQLQAENRKLRRENEELQGKVKGLERQKENAVEGYRLLEWRKNQLLDQLVAMQDKESDQYWAWQPDFEENHLESLSCPVLIPAAWLRELLDEKNEKIKILIVAMEEILKLETSEDRWGGHISETGKIAQHALVDAKELKL